MAAQAPAQKPSFEVTSVKPSDPRQRGGAITNQPGGRVVVRGMPLREIMSFAYRVRNFQISGGPGWVGMDRWDIEARAEEGSIPRPTGPPDPNTPDAIAIRLQSLLEDRFQLKIHRDTKELPIYKLSIAKGGSKMKLSEDQTPFQQLEGDALPVLPTNEPMPRFSIRGGRGSIEAVAMDMAIIVQALSSSLGGTVVDNTGLKGLYDIKLEWTPDVAPAGLVGSGRPEPASAIEPNSPSIFTAIQEQLGLKLESAKGPVEVLVIDHVERPSEN
jgi:uncharacterized protein (TIGR03435 family)